MFISSDSYEGGKQAGKAVVELWRSNSLKQRLIILSKSNKRYLRRDSVQSNCPKKEIMGRNSGEKIADFLDHKTVIAIEGIGMYAGINWYCCSSPRARYKRDSTVLTAIPSDSAIWL